MSLSEFQLLRPRTLREALAFLTEHSESLRVLAGGTDLLPSMGQKLFEPEHLLDLRQLPELKGIRQTEQGTEIGALTTLHEIERSQFLREHYPVLVEAAKTIASPVLRNMGTIGGNICLDTRCLWYNQSLAWRKSCGFCIKKDGDLCHVAPGGKKCWAAFSGDPPAELLCLNAEIEIVGPKGFRRVPLKDFYANDGVVRMKLEKNEMLTRIFLPESMSGWQGAYLKLRIRGSIDYPLAGVAVAIKKNGVVQDARAAITGVNPAPHLIPNVADALRGKPMKDDAEHNATVVGELAAKVAKPLTTSALTPDYRREMIRVFAKRAVLAALKH